MKRNRKRLLVAGETVVLVSGSLYAVGFLNWTGANTLSEATQYLRQMSVKLVNQNNKIKDAKSENDNLKNQISQLEQQKNDLQRELEELKNQVPSQEEIANKEQQIIELNNQIIELNNQIISKQNEVDHLTSQLEAANSAAATQQTVLDEVKQTLANEGINIYNMHE